MDPVTALTIDKGQKNAALLVQPQYSPVPVEKQIAILYCGTNGLLKNVPINQVHEFESDFLQILETQYNDSVLDQLRKGIINDDVTNILRKVAEEISGRYKN